MMPGKRDTVMVQENGVRVTKQKMFMGMTIREAYALFKEKYPNDVSMKHNQIYVSIVKSVSLPLQDIGSSKFASLRPPEVQLTGSLPRQVCQCPYHQNII